MERRLLLSGTGTVNGTVYNDLNANGVQDAGEPGIAGITMTLTPATGTAYTTQTGSNGAYSFQNIPAANYALSEMAPSPLMYDSDTWNLSIVAGQTVTAPVYSVRPAGSGKQISGQVWDDINNNLQHDSGEHGLAGATVYLAGGGVDYYAPGDVSAITDSQGTFQITVTTPAGQYLVGDNPPYGYEITDPSAFRNPSSGTNLIFTSTVSDRQFVLNVNFTVAPEPSTSTIAGFLFSDTNGDGAMGTGEQGLGSVPIFLDLNYNGVLDSGEPSTVTSASGQYSFANVLVGYYYIHPQVGSNYILTDAKAQYDSKIVFYPLPGSTTTGLNIGEIPTSDTVSESGRVFNDYNANGQYDAGEPGFAGLRVYDDVNGNGQYDSNEPSAITDSNGNYIISDLIPYKVNLKLVTQSGWSATPIANSSDVWFADRPIGIGNITGAFFSDNNGNGVQDTGEGGLQDFSVYIDMNNDGTYDSPDLITSTDANGNFSFPNISAGTYTIRAKPVSGWGQTYPAQEAGQVVTVNPSQTVSGIDVGLARTNCAISGAIFNDVNGNRVQDAGESGIGGSTVYADLNNNDQLDANEPSATSNSNGIYTISGLTAGTHLLRLIPQTGWAQTYPAASATQSVTLSNAQTASGVNFGVAQANASISVSTFNDLNGDGIQEANETSSAGGQIFIDSNGNGVYDAGEPEITAGASFTGLLPGSYLIRALPASGWTQTGPASGKGETVTVSAGQAVVAPAFGEAQSNASISGTFFYDTNGNVVWDSGEAISPSWGVFLDTNGDGIYESGEPELICNTQGQYTFSNLLPGTYRVHPTSATNWTETAPPGGTQIVNAISGQTIANVNFGEVKGAAKTSATPTALFTGDSYSVNLSYGGFHSVTSWTLNWGDGSVQTITGSPASTSHTYTSGSGTSPFTILAWANTVDGDAPAAALTLAVYAAPLLNNGLLSLAGTSGNDSVSFTNSGGLLTLSLDGATRQYNSSAVTKVTYSSNGGNDSINLTGAIPATINLASGNSTVTNSDSSPVFVAAGTGKTTINATSGTTVIPANSGTGIQQLAFAAINISSGAKVVFATSSSTLGDYSHHANRNVAVVDAGGLNISSGGTLDMGDNDMILKYTPANEAATKTQVFNLLQSGITTNNDWSGTGITSSEANYDNNFGIGARAVGFMDNNDWGDTSFDGVALADFNQVLVKFTYYGDVNCDGIFDSQDVNQLIGGRSHTPGNTGWENCDLDYDGVTSTSTDQNLFFTGRSAYQKFGAL